MVDFLIAKLHDVRFMTMLFAAIAASLTVYALVMPLLAGANMAKRMKAVASERERMRQRERERLNKSEKVTLRQTPKQVVSRVVEDFNLTKYLAQEAAREKLVMAGYRGPAHYVPFLFARLVTPIVLFIGAVLYVFVISQMQKSLPIKIGICVGIAYLGLQAPMLFLKNAISKRQLQVKRAFPDALDLLLICIESGMSVEVAFRKVAGVHADHGRAVVPAGPQSRLREPGAAHRARRRQVGLSGADAVGTLRHAARPVAPRDGAGKPRHAHERGREEGSRAAAQAHRADDPVLSAGDLRHHPRAVDHPGDEARVVVRNSQHMGAESLRALCVWAWPSERIVAGRIDAAGLDELADIADLVLGQAMVGAMKAGRLALVADA